MTRAQTGKSSIIGMIAKMFLFFGVIGSPLIWWLDENITQHNVEEVYNPLAGENQLVMSDEVTHSPGTLTFAYFAGVAFVIFMGWMLMRFICGLLFHGDPQYKQWRRQGGDPYFDSLAAPFNTDDDETRERY